MKSFAVNPPSHEAHDGKSYYEKQYFVLLWCKQSLFPCQFGQIKNVSGKRWWILSGFRLWQEQSIHKHSCLRLTKWSAAHYFCFIFVNSDALFTELHSKPAKQTELLLSTSAQSCCILLCLLGNCAPTLTQRKLGPDIPICVGATLLCTCKRTKNLLIPYFWVCAQLSILLYVLDAIQVTMLLLLQVGGLVLPKLCFSCDMLCRDRVLFQKILGTDLSTLYTNVKLSISSEIRSTDYFVNYTIDFSAFQATRWKQQEAQYSVCLFPSSVPVQHCTPHLCSLTSFQTRGLLCVSHVGDVPQLCPSFPLASKLFLLFLYPLGGEVPELHVVFQRKLHRENACRGPHWCDLFFLLL